MIVETLEQAIDFTSWCEKCAECDIDRAAAILRAEVLRLQKEVEELQRALLTSR